MAEAADSLAEDALEEPEEVEEPVSEASAESPLAVDDAVGEVLLPEEIAEKAELVLLLEG